MTRTTMTYRWAAAMALAGAAAIAAYAAVVAAQGAAPPSGLTRTIVQKADLSTPGREVVVARVEVAPGGVAGWHTHPGEEVSYILEGEAELLIAGQPPRKVAAGEAFVVPAGVAHNARNASGVPVKLVGMYIVDKDKPLASPAQAPAQ